MNKNLKQIAVPLVSVLLIGLVLGIIKVGLSYDALLGIRNSSCLRAFGSIKSWGNISCAIATDLVALDLVQRRAGLTLDFQVRLAG